MRRVEGYHFTQGFGLKLQTVEVLIIFIFLNAHRKNSCICNKYFSYSKHYIKHAVTHPDVNYNVLSRFIFIVCQFRSLSPISYYIYAEMSLDLLVFKRHLLIKDKVSYLT
jgi:hypothetical protein